MIISHKYRFIFLRTRKTAGTSIEIALSKFCGPDDVITYLSPPADEKTRKQLGYPGNQNCDPFAWDDRYKNKSTHSLPRKIARFIRGGRSNRLFHDAHCTAKQVKYWLDADIWNTYYKFCFERNTFDKLVSFYYWTSRGLEVEEALTFREFLESGYPGCLANNYCIYTIADEIAVDKICQFENLNEELETLRLKLGLPERLELQKAKTHIRKHRGHYRELFTEQDRTRVEKLFAREIKLFDYRF